MRFTMAFLLAIALGVACASGESKAPPAPQMPDAWQVISDEDFAPNEIRVVSDRLGAELSALRNTTYDVAGERVKLNILVSASDEDAEKIVAALSEMKPEEFFWREERLVFEFVGSNASIPAIREARALLTER